MSSARAPTPAGRVRRGPAVKATSGAAGEVNPAAVGPPPPWLRPPPTREPSAGRWRVGGTSYALGMTTPELGAHIDREDPVVAAPERSCDIVQIFLGDPQDWKGPVVDYPGGAAGLRTAAEKAGIGLYVHAPYVMNVATTNNRIRIPSRKLLQQ